MAGLDGAEVSEACGSQTRRHLIPWDAGSVRLYEVLRAASLTTFPPSSFGTSSGCCGTVLRFNCNFARRRDNATT